MNTITIDCEDTTLHHKLAVQLLFHGKEECQPLHAWGPGVRTCYILHFINNGTGKFTIAGQTYQLSRGHGFLIPPHTLVHYEADQSDPWEYCWIGFQGLQVKTLLLRAGLSEKQPIFKFSDLELIDQLHTQLLTSSLSKAYDLLLQSIIYQVFAEIVEQRVHLPLAIENNKITVEHYLQKAKDYIEININQKFSTKNIGHHIGLNSSYLSRLFKLKYGVSLKTYILQYRITLAIELLNDEYLTISDIARSVGYTDLFVFSKTFKKITGQSPSDMRLKTTKNHQTLSDG